MKKIAENTHKAIAGIKYAIASTNDDVENERNQPKHQKSSENKIEKVEKTNEQIDVLVEHKLLCELTFMCFACALDGNHQLAVPMSVCVRVYVIGKLGGH